MLRESHRARPRCRTGQVRTIAGLIAYLRTSRVRFTRWRCFFLVGVVAGILPAAFDVTAADAGDAGRQERRQARGWLQLKQDQKTFRESVEPLSPRQAGRLDRFELYREGRVRELEQRQRRSLSLERSFRRGADVERPKSRSRGLKEQRQFDRQRLETGILRRTLRPGRF